MEGIINHHPHEKGQSLVEFAISLVMLLVLLAGAVDGGRALFTYLAMRDAAQEGATFASINPASTSAIEQRVRNSSNLLSSLGGSLIVTVTPTVTGKLCAGRAGAVDFGIEVRLDYPNFPLTMPFIGMFVGSNNTVPISAEANDMIIIPKCP
ncbi:MAG: TadE family protein [Chloroflexota bacterium]